MVITTASYSFFTITPDTISTTIPVSAPPPASPIRPLGYRAAMIRLRAEATFTSHSLPLPPLLPIPAPTSSPPLLLPSTNQSSYAAARPAGGLRADYGFVAIMDREIRRDLERCWIWDPPRHLGIKDSF
ncbi:hypothetical protein Tco_0791772 [Tanacetum coccineum]